MKLDRIQTHSMQWKLLGYCITKSKCCAVTQLTTVVNQLYRY